MAHDVGHGPPPEWVEGFGKALDEALKKAAEAEAEEAAFRAEHADTYRRLYGSSPSQPSKAVIVAPSRVRVRVRAPRSRSFARRIRRSSRGDPDSSEPEPPLAPVSVGGSP
jgi:hypothetical protein